MDNNTITDIFFDLDHTLWDFDKNSVLAFDTIFIESHPTINTQVFIEIYAPINQACWKLYQVDKITHEELRYQRLKQSFDAINYSISDEAIHKIANQYIDFFFYLDKTPAKRTAMAATTILESICTFIQVKPAY